MAARTTILSPWSILDKKRFRKRMKRVGDKIASLPKTTRKRLMRGTRLARFELAARVSELLDRPMHRNYLPKLFNSMGLTGVGAEIGVKRGKFSEILLSNWKGNKLYLVDPWREQDASYVDRANVAQQLHEEFYNETLRRLKKFKDRIEVIRDFSVDAAKVVPDESLDFVYVDARHDYESVLEDLGAWERKVKVGGVICGHDYLDGMVNGTPFGVKRAVKKYLKENGHPGIILRRTWEPWPSFYWVKEPPGSPFGEFHSTRYWQNRYASKKTSGRGSYGKLGEYKASVVNQMVAELSIKSIVEFGSGDGAQASLFQVQQYVGVDVSVDAIDTARRLNAERSGFQFQLTTEPIPDDDFDMAVSLDVIYHLVEDDVFGAYMRQLFGMNSKYVLIYSTNYDSKSKARHIRHRHFSAWIKANAKGWRLEQSIPNPFSAPGVGKEDRTKANFFLFVRESRK